MYDFRPVGHVIGRLIIVLGASMLAPLLLDVMDGNGNADGFVLATFLTLAAGLAMTLITRQSEAHGLTRPQAFMLTVLVWVVLPVFGALPLFFGAPAASYTDAYFEAMSGLTTTGATVFTGLDDAPRGMLLWRALLQWYGGVGIVIVAIVFLPMMRIGGMQFFRSESFDLSSDVMPRATELAASLFYVYLVLSLACVLAYSAAGMNGFDALAHAMTTVSTGGYGTHDSGFENFSPSAQYVAILFMWLAALPFIRFIQLARGNTRGIRGDSQIQAFLAIIALASATMVIWLVLNDRHPLPDAIREALFNVTSAMTGTGYASDPYDTWGTVPVALFFVIPLIGGCTGGLHRLDLVLGQGVPLSGAVCGACGADPAHPLAARGVSAALPGPPGRARSGLVDHGLLLRFRLRFVDLGDPAVAAGAGHHHRDLGLGRLAGKYRAGAWAGGWAVGQLRQPAGHGEMAAVAGDAARKAGVSQRAGAVHADLLAAVGSSFCACAGLAIRLHKKLCGSMSITTRIADGTFTPARQRASACCSATPFGALTSRRTRVRPRTRAIGAGAGPKTSAPVLSSTA
jgi:trk system potassium uptake protein TrkH